MADQQVPTPSGGLRATTLYLRARGVQVVGFSGKAKCGKDYLMDRTAVHWGFLPMALANHFKVDLIAKHGMDVAAAWFRDKTPEERALMQVRGTEDGRDVYGDQIWIHHLEAWMCYFAAKGFTRFAISDVRFQNEVDWVVSLGHVYRIEGRGGLTNGREAHRSETELDGLTGCARTFDNSVANQYAVITQIIDALHQDFLLGDYGLHLSQPAR